MAHLSNIDDLINAINSLRPNPVIEVLVPAVSGVIGVVAGFFLSVAKGNFDRRAARREEVAGAIRDRRQKALDVFSPEMKWISEHPGYFGSTGDWSPHEKARSDARLFLLQTGKVSDEEVGVEVTRFMMTLDAVIRSYHWVQPSAAGWNINSEIDKVLPTIRSEVSRSRAVSQDWVNGDFESSWLADRLTASRDRLHEMRDQSEEGAKNYASAHFRES